MYDKKVDDETRLSSHAHFTLYSANSHQQGYLPQSSRNMKHLDEPSSSCTQPGTHLYGPRGTLTPREIEPSFGLFFRSVVCLFRPRIFPYRSFLWQTTKTRRGGETPQWWSAAHLSLSSRTSTRCVGCVRVYPRQVVLRIEHAKTITSSRFDFVRVRLHEKLKKVVHEVHKKVDLSKLIWKAPITHYDTFFWIGRLLLLFSYAIMYTD